MKSATILLCAALFAAQAIAFDSDKNAAVPSYVSELAVKIPSIVEAHNAAAKLVKNGDAAAEFCYTSISRLSKKMPLLSKSYPGAITQYAMEHFMKENIGDMFESLSRRDQVSVTKAFIALDKGLKTLSPIFPSLIKSATVLSETPITPSTKLETIYSTLDKALRPLIPAFPILKDTLLILTEALPGLAQALPAIDQHVSVTYTGSYTPSKISQHDVDLFSKLPEEDHLVAAVTHSFIALNTALRNLNPAFPALVNSLGHLSKALPKMTKILAKYSKHYENNANLASPYLTIPREIEALLEENTDALNEGLKSLIPIFPLLADTVLLLSKELPILAPALPALVRYTTVVAESAITPELLEAIPSLKEAVSVINEGVAEASAKGLPSLMAALPYISAAVQNALEN